MSDSESRDPSGSTKPHPRNFGVSVPPLPRLLPHVDSLPEADLRSFDHVAVDPDNLAAALAMSVYKSPSLEASDFSVYAGPDHSCEPIKFADPEISFDEKRPYNYQSTTPPHITGAATLLSAGSVVLPLFSPASGTISRARTPRLDDDVYGALMEPCMSPKSLELYGSVDDELLIQADVSSLAHAPQEQTVLPSSMALDADAYSDYDGGHEGYRLSPNACFYSSALDLEGTASAAPVKRKHKSQENMHSPSLVRAAPVKQKNSLRRRSRNSEPNSEKSHRSEFHLGSGYTQTPTTGKIFRNLLILEESLCQQVIQQRALRRKYVAFLAALCSLIASISHHLYVSEQRGPFRVLLQLLLLMLVVTLLLYHLSGEYQKTIVLPRRFLSSANKGLRQLNVRLVKIKTSYTDSSADIIREVCLFLCSMALKFCHTAFPSMIQNPNSKLEIWLVLAQLRFRPRFGLNDVKLVLIPRSFSTDIREGWELYRNEFWANEGVRRRNAALVFTRPKPYKKSPKDKVRKRRLSAPPLPNLSEDNLNVLDESQGMLSMEL